MSIFVNENAMPISNPVEADTSYFGESGAYTLLTENVMNDMAMFNSIIAGDFAESQAVHENASADQLVVLTENAGTRLVENIKAFLKKAYEKVKGLIETFINRMTTVVIRDNKKLVEKYRAQVLGKNLDDGFKYNWSSVKGDKDAVFPKVIINSDVIVDNVARYTTKDLSSADIKNIRASDYNTKLESLKTAEGKADLLSKTFNVGKIEYSSVLKDIQNELFDEKEEKSGLNDTLRSAIFNALTNSKDLIDGLKKAKRKVDDIYNSHLKSIERSQKLFTDMVNKGGAQTGGPSGNAYTEERSVDSLKALNAYYEFIKVEQEVTTRSLSVMMSVSKMKIKEARSVFVRAVSYRGGTEALNNSGNLFIESSDASNDVVEGDKETTVEINIEIEDPQNEPELVEALEDESDAIVEEQFHGGYDY